MLAAIAARHDSTGPRRATPSRTTSSSSGAIWIRRSIGDFFLRRVAPGSSTQACIRHMRQFVGFDPALSARLQPLRSLRLGGAAGKGAMSGTRRFETQAEATEAANRQTVSLAGLAVTLAVLVVCIFLVRQLAHATKVEDCLMAHRLNCDKVATAAR